LTIPLAPGPALRSLTDNWIKRHASDGAIAFSMLLHSKGLTQNMLDDVRTYTHWLHSRYGGQMAFLTFLELARLLKGGRHRTEMGLGPEAPRVVPAPSYGPPAV
jgi:hypothetical protein